MSKYIKKKALKDAIDNCPWYHINKNGELVAGANSDDHEPLYKYSDIKRIIKGLPTRRMMPLHGLFTDTFSWAIAFVDGVPSADVVEVVRCKDCKYGEVNDACDDEVICCNDYASWSKNGFCSDGERKDHE